MEKLEPLENDDIGFLTIFVSPIWHQIIHLGTLSFENVLGLHIKDIRQWHEKPSTMSIDRNRASVELEFRHVSTVATMTGRNFDY